MKISQASKKVLCGALSAAMVVAFAPTVAFGAQADGSAKIKVTYDLDGGVETPAYGTQYLESEQTPVIEGTNTVSVEDAEIQYAISTGKPGQNSPLWSDTLAGTVAVNTSVWAKVSFAGVTEIVKIGTVLTTQIDDIAGKVSAEVNYANGGSSEPTSFVSDEPVQPTDTATYAYAQATFTTTAQRLSLETEDAVVEVLGVQARDINKTSIDIQQPTGALEKDGYAFKSWAVYYDADGDGSYETKGSKDINGTQKITTGTMDVSDARYGNGSQILLKAVYDAPVIDTYNWDFVQVDAAPTNAALTGKATFTPTVTVNNTIKAVAGRTYSVELSKDGSVIASKPLSLTNKVDFDEVAVEVGEYALTLKDSEGNVLDTKKMSIGAAVISGGYYASRTAGINAASQTVYYDATADTTYAAILGAANLGGLDIVAVKDPTVVAPVDAYKIYTADGKVAYDVATTTGTDEKVKKGAQTIQLTSVFAEDAILSAAEENATLSVDVWTTNPSYYLTVADPSGAIVKENSGTVVAAGFKAIDTDDDNDFAVACTTGYKHFELGLDKLTAGDYTIALYKVTAAAGNLDATVKLVGTKTVTVSVAAAPSWSYAPNADVTKGGVLTLANNAGDAYKVQFKTTGAYSDYTTGIVLDKDTFLAGNYTIKATAKDATKTSPDDSAEITLYGYNQDGGIITFNAWANAAKAELISGSKIDTYGANADVKAAIDAAKKTFTDKGFAEGTKGAEKAWAADVLAGEKAVLASIAGVAKAEVEALYAGVADKDGNVTKLSTDNYEAAIAAIDAVTTAFDANTNTVTTDNVLKVNNQNLSTADTYTKAVNNALETAQKAAVKYAKADVEAAAAVTETLKAATTGEAAEAAIKAYAALTDTQKELVATADLAAAEAVKDAADKAAAEEEAKKAEAEAAAALVVEQDKAAVNYCNSTKSKTITLKKGVKKTQKAQTVKWNSKVSASGNIVTYSWKSGSNKIKVAAGGVATLKKGTKAGTYKAKVTVTCGAATRTVTVKFVVK